MSYYTGTAEELEKAKKLKNYYITMSGDYGGDPYLCYPAKYIKCDFGTLQNLLHEIDAWGKEGEELDFVEIQQGKSWLTTGEGGGDELWLSKGLEKKRKQIQAILDNKNNKIGTNLNDVLSFLANLPAYIKSFFLIFNALNKKDKEDKK